MELKIPEGYGKAVGAAAETAKEFLGKLLGPAAEEAGLMLGDTLRLLRFKREVKILNEAKEFLRARGAEPTPVPLRILTPILEAGSLEENDSMATRWAALLATAADLTRKEEVLPSFPDILKQLSSLEARILEAVVDMVSQKGIPQREWPSRGAKGESLRSFLSADERSFEVALDNLFRLRLCAPPSVQLDFIDNKDHRFQLATKDLICITQLGYSFVSACQAPKPQGDQNVTPAGSANPVTASKLATTAHLVNQP